MSPLVRRRVVPLVMATTAALGVAGCGQPRSQPAASSSPTSAPLDGVALAGQSSVLSGPDHPGPTAVVDGVPMGYRQDRAGAIAAAVNFARLNEALVAMSEEQAAAARRAMAAENASEVLVEDILAQLGEFRGAWPNGELSYRVAPLAVRAQEAGPEVMRVDVWFVGVVAGRDLPTYEEWITESYRLVWERGDWRVAALSEVSGPRPDPGYQDPASPAEVSALLAGFEAVP